jgi:hypothetical protein
MIALPCGAARAQDPEGAEALARPRAGETVDFDLQSVRRYGDKVGRFEVVVSWGDSSGPKPADSLPRRVRYTTDCENETLTLSAVALYDAAGAIQKTLLVPPGAVDPVKPEKGSRELKWLRQVCLF